MVRVFAMVEDKELAKFKEIMLRHELGQERDIEHNTQELNKDCDDVCSYFFHLIL